MYRNGLEQAGCGIITDNVATIDFQESPSVLYRCHNGFIDRFAHCTLVYIKIKSDKTHYVL